MANDSSLLPSVAAAPGSPTQGATANPYDYSAHLDRLVIALDQLSVSMSFIADKIDNISDKLSDLAVQSTLQSSLLSNVSVNSSTLATNSTIFTNLANGAGIHMIGPQDWLGLVSTYRLYVEDTGSIGLTALQGYKAKIDALPKTF